MKGWGGYANPQLSPMGVGILNLTRFCLNHVFGIISEAFSQLKGTDYVVTIWERGRMQAGVPVCILDFIKLWLICFTVLGIVREAFSQLMGIESAIESRGEAEKFAKVKQDLWVAVTALKQAVGLEHRIPLGTMWMWKPSGNQNDTIRHHAD
jgi:hypothetical protein